ncbi:hypothetical protein LJR225_003325 [Phenylobacterium sp. LjRoot225]
MTDVLALKRRRQPEDPGVALAFFSLIAAAGFAAGWAAQLLVGF